MNLQSPINLTDVAKIPAINDVWNDIKPDGSIGGVHLNKCN